MNIYNAKQLIASSKIMIYRSVIGSGLPTANIARVLMNITCPMVHITAAGIMKKLSPVASKAVDVPLVFPTVQLYVPKTSVTDWSVLSTV